MRLTKKKAIEIAIELWTWMAETGEALKRNWPGWEKYGQMDADCPFCEYADRRPIPGEDFCFSCPYYQVFGACCEDDSYTLYDKWDSAETIEDRKKYASLFLKELKQL